MATFQQNRGSDVIIQIQYVTDEFQPMDLTGYTFSIIEPVTFVDGDFTITNIDLTIGSIEVRIDWRSDIPPYSAQRPPSFRVVATNGADDVGSELISVEYQ